MLRLSYMGEANDSRHSKPGMRRSGSPNRAARAAIWRDPRKRSIARGLLSRNVAVTPTATSVRSTPTHEVRCMTIKMVEPMIGVFKGWRLTAAANENIRSVVWRSRAKTILGSGTASCT